MANYGEPARRGHAAHGGNDVRAVVYDRYGPPEVLRVKDVPEPEPAGDQVLVAVVATSVNLSDWECLTGYPVYGRIGGLRAPRRRILGSDVAGRVEAVGGDVTRFRVGDEVMGDNLDLMGGFAERVVVPESALARKPERLSFAEASTLPQSGAIALQGTAEAAPGKRVLVNGGGGGSGSFAIQLAKRAGAHVTAVDNDRKLGFMISLGADEVLDYRRQDFTKLGETWDLIFDLVAVGSAWGYRRALARGGRYRCVGGTIPTMLRVATVGAVAGFATGRSLGMLMVKQGPEHFLPLAELCAAGEVAVHIDVIFGLDEVPAALARVGEGLSLGKVVVQVDWD